MTLGRLFRIAVAVALFSLGGLLALGQEKPAAPEAKAADVAASLPPSGEFLARYDDLAALIRVLDQIDRETGFRAIARRAQQLQNVIQAEIPRGYRLNEETRRFEPLPAEKPSAPSAALGTSSSPQPPAKPETKKP